MKKAVVIIAAVLLGLFISSLTLGNSVKGTVIELVDDAVIVASKDGKKVICVEDYRSYTPGGEEWSVGDKVVVRHNSAFRQMDLHRVD